MLSRREFAASLAGLAAASAQTPRRNILLITNDQFRGDCLGAMGNRLIRTPNLDRLASEGTLFEQYFVQCPQCVPSRSGPRGTIQKDRGLCNQSRSGPLDRS